MIKLAFYLPKTLFSLVLSLGIAVPIHNAYSNSRPSTEKDEAYHLILRDFNKLDNPGNYKNNVKREEKIVQHVISKNDIERLKYQINVKYRNNRNWDKTYLQTASYQDNELYHKVRAFQTKSNDNKFYVSDDLLISLPSDLKSFTVSVTSINPAQGSTFAVYLTAKTPLSILAANFGNRQIKFFLVKENVYRAFVGIDVQDLARQVPLRILALPKNATPLLFQYNLRIKERYTRIRKKRKKRRRGSVRVNLPKNKRKLLKGNNKIIERNFFTQHFKASSPKKRWAGLFKWPIRTSRSRVRSFGRYRTYILGKNTVIRAYHRGIDISSPKGTPVKASNNGIIAVAAHYNIRGNAILINHGQGIYTAYYHLSRIRVKVGQSVKKGELIGRVGTTGLSTGPHLHWELRINGVSVNPDHWCRYLYPYKFAILLPRQAKPIRKSSNYNNSYHNKKIAYHQTSRKNDRFFRPSRPGNLITIDRFE
ncbi:MAG: hypothetical protein IEMM0008_1216 [bacterium]|nr:MAG: hypothetical protein IEMM0008_1216 [bacterium]